MAPADLPPNADCPPPRWVCIIEEEAADYLELAARLTRSIRTSSGSTIGEVVDRHALQPDPIVKFRKEPPSNQTVHPDITLRSAQTT